LSCLVALFRRNDMNNHFFMLRYKQYKLDLVKRKFVTPHNVINLSKKEFLVLELLFRYTYSDKEEIKNHLNSNALGYVRSINYIMTTLNKIFYVNSDLLIKYIHGKYYLCTRAT
jgi:DNA-binding response OmpR family regulator